MTNKVRIYLGAGLFNERDQFYNKYLAERIRGHHFMGELVDLYLPQENQEINDKNSFASSVNIANADTNKLLESDILVAVLDGDTIDAGLASEIGIAYAKGIPIVGLYTDIRQFGTNNKDKIAALNDVCENQFSYINLFTVGLIKENGVIVRNSDSLMAELSMLVKDLFAFKESL